MRIVALSVLLAFCTTASAAVSSCNLNCTYLVAQARSLANQGNYGEALANYRAAIAADPQSSAPLSAQATLLLELALDMKPESAAKARAAGRAMAGKALQMAPDDTVAAEALREAEDDAPARHEPTPAAAALLVEGDRLFGQHRYDDARAQYEAAARADPALSTAWLFAGDCYFHQQDWVRAEALFRRAAGIEPRNSQAWRFVFDALEKQGKRGELDTVLLQAIAADPSQRPNWARLASTRAAAGRPLMPLGLQRGAWVVRNDAGKDELRLIAPPGAAADGPDVAFRKLLGEAELALRSADPSGKRPRYDIELESWRRALAAFERRKAATGEDLTEPALVRMRAFAQDGELEPAILVLLYRRAYAPALDAWQAAHPDGLQAFIDRHGVRP